MANSTERQLTFLFPTEPLDDEQTAETPMSFRFTVVITAIVVAMVLFFKITFFLYVKCKPRCTQPRQTNPPITRTNNQDDAQTFTDHLTRCKAVQNIVAVYPTRDRSTLQDSECSICLSAFDGQSKGKELQCGHCFHDTCLSRWVVSEIESSSAASLPHCPLCKAEMTTFRSVLMPDTLPI